MIRVRQPRTEPTFADAPAFRAAGYVPCGWNWGASAPTGPWKKFRLDGASADSGIGILCTAPPNFNSRAAVEPRVENTYCAALEVNVFDKKAAAQIDALVLGKLRWVDGVASRLSPVRVASDATTLRPFALTGRAFPRMSTRPFVLSRDNHRAVTFRPHQATWLCAEAAFCVSGWDFAKKPFEWHGRALPSVTRAQLPTIDANAARDLLGAVEAILGAQ